MQQTPKEEAAKRESTETGDKKEVWEAEGDSVRKDKGESLIKGRYDQECQFQRDIK